MTRRPRPVRLRLGGLLLGAAVAILVGACGGGDQLAQEPEEAVTVVPSDAYAAKVGPQKQRERMTALIGDVTRLRAEGAGNGGWTVRQDDVTGYASELAGGVWTAPASNPVDASYQFLERHGRAFAIADRGQLSISAAPPDALGIAVIRGRQLHRGVPVDGSSLLIHVRVRGDSGPPTGALPTTTVELVRGRVFPDLTVDPAPAITADAARQAAETAVGPLTTGSGLDLIVYTATPEPVLAWSALVRPAPSAPGPPGTPAAPGRRLGGSTARVFVSARDGSILEVRELSSEFAASRSLRVSGPSAGAVAPQTETDLRTRAIYGNFTANLPRAGQPVVASGRVVGGFAVTATVELVPGGNGAIQFVDASRPGSDRVTRQALISIHDGSTLTTDEADALLGAGRPVVTSPSNRDADRDSLSVMWAAQQVLGYFRDVHGRDSWDGQGSPLVATVKVDELCNAFYATLPAESQMVFGGKCGGLDSSAVDISIVSHEIGHGVTHSHSFELGGSFSGTAVDEGTSDYWGVVVMNRALGTNYTSEGPFSCQLDGRDCPVLPDGLKGSRSVESGATLDDLQLRVGEPFGLSTMLGDDGHDASMIYTNALWSMRRRFTAIAGGDNNTSPGAVMFDRIVYRAVTTYYTDQTDLFAAADAVERAARDLGTPEHVRIVRDQFRASKLCRACRSAGRAGTPIRVSTSLKTKPVVGGRGVAYTDHSSALRSQSVTSPVAGDPVAINTRGALTYATDAAGDFVSLLQYDLAANTAEVIVVNVATGAARVVSTNPDSVEPSLTRSGIAVVDGPPGPTVLRWVPHGGGAERSLALTGRVNHVAAASRSATVAVELADGTIVLWNPESGSVTPVLTVPTPNRPWIEVDVLRAPGGLVFDGRRLAVLALGETIEDWHLIVVDVDGSTASVVSTRASSKGVALDRDYLVWSENVARQGGRVAAISQRDAYDTDIELFSFATGRFYRVFPQRGQQGFPDLENGRLVYQDSVNAGDDIYTLVLPAGL